MQVFFWMHVGMELARLAAEKDDTQKIQAAGVLAGVHQRLFPGLTTI